MNTEMIENFQCPGCVCGSNTKCGNFKVINGSFDGLRCDGHVAGTRMSMIGSIYLGLPKGFNRVGKSHDSCEIWLYENKQFEYYNFCTLPIWAMEQDGYLFVRCYMPRVNMAVVQVIKCATSKELIEYCLKNKIPFPQDVAEFYDEID